MDGQRINVAVEAVEAWWIPSPRRASIGAPASRLPVALASTDQVLTVPKFYGSHFKSTAPRGRTSIPKGQTGACALLPFIAVPCLPSAMRVAALPLLFHDRALQCPTAAAARARIAHLLIHAHRCPCVDYVVHLLIHALRCPTVDRPARASPAVARSIVVRATPPRPARSSHPRVLECPSASVPTWARQKLHRRLPLCTCHTRPHRYGQLRITRDSLIVSNNFWDSLGALWWCVSDRWTEVHRLIALRD